MNTDRIVKPLSFSEEVVTMSPNQALYALLCLLQWSSRDPEFDAGLEIGVDKELDWEEPDMEFLQTPF